MFSPGEIIGSYGLFMAIVIGTTYAISTYIKRRSNKKSAHDEIIERLQKEKEDLYRRKIHDIDAMHSVITSLEHERNRIIFEKDDMHKERNIALDNLNNAEITIDHLRNENDTLRKCIAIHELIGKKDTKIINELRQEVAHLESERAYHE